MSSIVWATVLIGLVLLAVALVTTRGVASDGYAGRITGLLEPDGNGGASPSLLETPMGRLVGGVVVALVAGGAVVLAVGEDHTLVGALVLVVVAGLFAGSYVAVEQRRLSPAAALLVSAGITGALLVVVVVLELVNA